ncbi:MAG: hypothetical protein L3J86_04110 [Thermoplasmata archaeon]|nr:hypothetical protein [Thermoplasmata archaeon]
MRVISTLLVADSLPERERIRLSGLSPRTYETARRRLFDAGIVYERFVPDPLAWGLQCLRLDLVRPKPGHAAAWSERFAATPGAFHVWQGDGLVFAASLLRARKASDETKFRNEQLDANRSWQLDVDLRQPSVPIYFDFEGAWSRIAGAPGPRVYPRPLPHWPGGDSLEQARIPESLRRGAEDLIRTPFRAHGGRATGRHLGSVLGFGGPKGATAIGLVQRRGFLDLAKIPAIDGWQLQGLSFVTGTIRKGTQPESLYQELLGECGMTPFLFATDGGSVLIGALSPAPRAVAPPSRTRISEILTKRLEPWSLVNTPVPFLSTPLNHRYDRLLGGGVP